MAGVESRARGESADGGDGAARPLTVDQQRLCERWRPLALALTLKRLHVAGLAHHEDEAAGLAADALVSAAQRWVPAESRFPWYLRMRVQAVMSRFIHRHPETTSLDELLPGSDLDTFASRLSAEREEEGAASDARDLSRRAEAEIVDRLVQGRDGDVARRQAHEAFETWWACAMEGRSGAEVARAHGVSPQAVAMRLARVQRVVEAWARAVRGDTPAKNRRGGLASDRAGTAVGRDPSARAEGQRAGCDDLACHRLAEHGLIS
ncbi:hypothetical protein [Myxococcus sp. CA040A]|uniref:hypothetical protein n=1 Tax=Myxococcus sp. CA040A TaxID=2741738 RepID=UPI00157A72A6|nr:hypothetical protein [Myxococcus sp. CA040A]NTX07077.1 hypothetical protein [Myxococcus sp. CA040A]